NVPVLGREWLHERLAPDPSRSPVALWSGSGDDRGHSRASGWAHHLGGCGPMGRRDRNGDGSNARSNSKVVRHANRDSTEPRWPQGFYRCALGGRWSDCTKRATWLAGGSAFANTVFRRRAVTTDARSRSTSRYPGCIRFVGEARPVNRRGPDTASL